MEAITLTELSTLIEKQWDDPVGKPLLVLLDIEGCHACQSFYRQLEAPDVLAVLTEVVEVKRVMLEDRVPPFAPPVYPCAVGFIGGVRHWEGLGDPGNVQTLLDSVHRWVQLGTGDQISLSPGYRSI